LLIFNPNFMIVAKEYFYSKKKVVKSLILIPLAGIVAMIFLSIRQAYPNIFIFLVINFPVFYFLLIIYRKLTFDRAVVSIFNDKIIINQFKLTLIISENIFHFDKIRCISTDIIKNNKFLCIKTIDGKEHKFGINDLDATHEEIVAEFNKRCPNIMDLGVGLYDV